FSKNPRPRQINPAISAEMERILMKSVAHKPEDRHASALELMRDLEAHRARIDPRAKSRGASGIRPEPVSYSPPPQRPQSIPDRQPVAVSPPVVTPQPPVAPPPSAEWVYCGHCGEKIGSDDVYCAHCGEHQPSAAAAAAGGGYTGKPGTGGRITAQLI